MTYEYRINDDLTVGFYKPQGTVGCVTLAVRGPAMGNHETRIQVLVSESEVTDLIEALTRMRNTKGWVAP